MVIIPGLPEHLRVVPPAPDSATDPEAEEKRRAWQTWATEVIRDNIRYRDNLRHNEKLRAAERLLCAQHPAYFLVRWCDIFEPRSGRRKAGAKPFIPAARQVELLEWLVERLQDEETERSDGIISKSRAVGATWIVCAFCVWGWMFRDPFSALLMSWKEEFVDGGTNKAIFWKIDFILKGVQHHAPWLLPNGFVLDKPFRKDRVLLHPNSYNELSGESTTTTAARGTRPDFVFFDEASFMKRFRIMWNGAAASTDHRVAASSESFDEHRDFYDLGLGNKDVVKPALFGFDWWEFPLNDEIWLERERKRFAKSPEAFENEYGRNPHAGSSDWIYSEAWDKQPDPAIVYNPVRGELYGGIDPGFADDFAVVWVQHDPVGNWWNVLDAYANKGRIADYYASIINGEFETGFGNYDDEAVRIMAWTITLGKCKWWGDPYGDNVHGATHDSIYTRLAQQGIRVNRTGRYGDQREESATKKAARTYRGRHEAVRDYLRRIRFADTPGARLMLTAMQYHRKMPDVESRINEPEKPVHDWTSHLCAALEYIFVNVKMRQHREANPIMAPTTVRLGGPALSRFAQERVA